MIQSKKKIVFIATREPSYSRVSLMHSCLAEHYDVRAILSTHPRYAARFCSVTLQLLLAWLRGQLRNCDAVVVGFLAQPMFAIVRWLYSGPIICDAYFSMYDTLVNDKQLASPSSLAGRICRRLDICMLRYATSCLTDTACHAEYFKSEFQQPQANIERWWISAECKPLDHAPRPPKEGQAMQVFFWGGFIPLQGVPYIVQAANLLKSQNIHFTVFGSGQTLDACEELKRQLGIHNIDFHGWKSAAEIRAQAQASHLALGIFGSTDKAARVIPNKVFEALAMGIPFITRHSPAAEELLTDGHDALMVAAAEPEQLADKILWVRDHYSTALQIAEQGKQTFARRAAPDQISKQLVEHIENATEAKAASIAPHDCATRRCAKRELICGPTQPCPFPSSLRPR